MQYPLEDLRVLDFSRVLAGPFAGRLLCDLGADVVKVEPPEGDITRYWGKDIGGLSGYFYQQNAGKRNICIDLAAEGAVSLVNQLVKQADLLIENYRPEVMPRLGIGYEQLAQVNPAIIMLSISGFGHGGPESHRPAYAPIIHAETGLIHRSSTDSALPYHDLPLASADTCASLHGLIGLLAALHQRHSTKQGQHIDIAMLDAMLATDDQLHYALEDSADTGPLPAEIWELPFGHALLSMDFRLMFRRLREEFGITDPARANMPLEEKIQVRHEAVRDFFHHLGTREKFTEAMTAINLVWGEVRTSKNIESQATVKARGSIAQIDDRQGGARPVVQSPYRFSHATSGVRGPAGFRGEDYTEVLTDWLSLSDAEIDALMTDGVLLYDEHWQPPR